MPATDDEPPKAELVPVRATDLLPNPDPREWRDAYEGALHAESFWPPIHDPGPSALDDDQAAAFLPDDDAVAEVTIKKTRNPAAHATLGLAGGFIEISAASPAIPGTLLLRVERQDQKAMGHGILRMARWNPANRALELVEPSRRGAGSYVWGRILSPGKYCLVGLPADAHARTAIAMLADARELAARLDPDDRAELHRGICDAAFVGAKGAKGTAGGRQQCLRLSEPFELPEFSLLSGATTAGEGWRRMAGVCLTDEHSIHRLGAISCLCLDGAEPSRLYVGSEWGGLWRLDNVADYPAGAVWRPLGGTGSPQGIAAVAVAPSEPRRLYVAETTGSVLRSDDSGGTWYAPVERRFQAPRRILVHPTDADRVLVAASGGIDSDEGGLWRSVDGGRAWERVLDGDIADAALGPAPGHLVLAAVQGVGLMRSSDGGGTWERTLPFVTAEAHGGSEMALAIGPPGEDGVATVAVAWGEEIFSNAGDGRGTRSAPAGHWVSLGRDASPVQGASPSLLAFDPFDPSTLFAGGEDLRVNGRFPDRGPKVWSTARAETPRCIEFDRKITGLIVLATDRALLCSLDRGGTWRDIGHGLGIQDITGLSVDGPAGVGRTPTGEWIYSSHALGNKWSALDDAAPGGRRAVPDPRQAGIFYVLGERLARVRHVGPGSTEIDDALGDFRPYCAAWGGVDGAAMLVGTDDRVLRLLHRSNGGEPDWDDPGSGWSDSPIVQLATSASEPRAAVALSAAGGVFRVNKADIRRWEGWDQVGSDGPRNAQALALNPVIPERMYAAANQQLWRSADGGASWSELRTDEDDQVPGSAVLALATHPRNGQVLFAATPLGVLISTDEGETWRTYNQGLPAAIVSGLAWADGELLISTLGWGLWRRRPHL